MAIAIITGGSRGLGKNMALHLADKGHGSIITYHSRKDEAEEVVKTIEEKGQKTAALQLDVSKPETFADFAESAKAALEATWGSTKFNYLVNNAGMGAYANFTEATEEQFDLLMNAHLKAPFFLSQKLLPFMMDGGRILNISSGLTRFTFPGYSVYGAMKGGVEVLSRYMALELGQRSITVNVLAPGAIETDFGGGMVRDNKELNEHISSITALGRVGQPDDIGGAVAMLLSDDAGWINGMRIEASGGQGL